MHLEFNKNSNLKIKTFFDIIKKSFNIGKSTIYEWINNSDINNKEQPIITDYKNDKITPIIELFIINNSKINSIKKFKKIIFDNFNIKLNKNEIACILEKNKIKTKKFKNDILIKKSKPVIIITSEHEQFIIENQTLSIKDITKLINKKFNINFCDKNIVSVLQKNKIKTKSFFKISEHIEKFIIDSITNNKILIADNIKTMILKEFKIDISKQSIYNIFKKNNLTYKKIKFNNNPYTINDQVIQLKEVTKKFNTKTVDKGISIDEMSVVLNSKPCFGWNSVNSICDYQLSNSKIISKRYTLLVASSNKKVLGYYMCEKGLKTDGFIDFMKILKEKDQTNNYYYILDNARIHHSKKFKNYVLEYNMNIVYNAPYHSEFNPIENVFSILRNKLNRSENKTYENIKSIVDDFLKINLEKELKNIFNHCAKMIEIFIEKNENK